MLGIFAAIIFSLYKARISSMIEILSFEVEEAFHKKSLYNFLVAKISQFSKMHIRALMDAGKCKVNGEINHTGHHVKEGDLVELEVNIKAETSMKAEDIPLDIIFEDNEIIVLNKPSGMLVHPTKGVRSGTLLNALAYYLNRDTNDSNFIRAGLIHRLDKKTSGLMVIAKTNRAHRILSGHFQRKLVDKVYCAAVEGTMAEDFGKIEAPIGRDAERQVWEIADYGKPSKSEWSVIERRKDSTLLQLIPVTGRTNQLRLHLAHIGHPIIGDDLYGGKDYHRLCLHAAKLTFWHPNGSNRLSFETDIPADFC